MFILIPAYKPDERMLALIDELHEKTDYRIMVVNDGSGSDFDKIFDKVPEYCVKLAHEVNRGKGRAMKTGFDWIAKNAPEEPGVVIADADGQHILTDIIRVADELIKNPRDVIIGARKFAGKVPLRSRFGNSLTRGVFTLASGVKLSDTQTGLRGIPQSLLPDMVNLKGERYEYEMNMLLSLAEKGIKMREVIIETVYLDDNASSHFHVLRDSFKIYAVIFKFICSSLIAFGIDFVVFMLLSMVTSSMSDMYMANLINVVGARIISSICNYFINMKVVFRGKHNLAQTLVKYYALAVVILVLNYCLINLLNVTCGWPLVWAKIVTEVVLFTGSFLVQRMFVFKNKPAAEK